MGGTQRAVGSRPVTLILVRHAHAGERNGWRDDDRLRPLSAKGERQADDLVAVLSDLEPKRILTSPALRCRQTVLPLGRSLGLDVIDDDRLLEGAATGRLDSVIDDADGTAIVLCTHGDIIPRILDELIDRGLVIDDAFRWQKASTWVLPHTPEHGWGTAGYLPPPPKR